MSCCSLGGFGGIHVRDCALAKPVTTRSEREAARRSSAIEVSRDGKTWQVRDEGVSYGDVRFVMKP